MQNPFKVGLHWLLARYPRKGVLVGISTAIIVLIVVVVVAVFVLFPDNAWGIVIFAPVVLLFLGTFAYIGVLHLYYLVTDMVNNLAPERKQHDDEDGEPETEAA